MTGRSAAAFLLIVLLAACAVSCGGRREGLAVSFDVEALPPQPPEPPPLPFDPAATTFALASPGPFEPGEKVQVRAEGPPGLSLALRLGSAGRAVPMTEDPASPGRYAGVLDLTGVAPGRHDLSAEGEGPAGRVALGPAVVEVVASRAQESLRRANARLSPAYFPTSRWEITPEARSALEADARVLRELGDFRATVEGHADERGSDRYNVALGMWRAKAAKEVLKSLGVDPARLTILSHGRSRPAAKGSDEESLARNRRVEIVIRGAS